MFRLLTILITLTLTATVTLANPQPDEKDQIMTKASTPPRKVIVATAMQGYYGQWSGLDDRLATLSTLIDDMAARCQSQYPGKSLDLVVLTEQAVTGGQSAPAAERSVKLKGKVLDTFAAKAKQYSTYIVVTLDLADEDDAYYNAAALIDREGKLVGIYRKVHPVGPLGSDILEGGITPGRQHPVFDCDFGKLGIQICYDMGFDRGWQSMAEQGAEIIAWPTMSPGVLKPAIRASQHDYWIVTSTWRNNASILEPTGLIAAQTTGPDLVLVHEIDLSYLILPWSSELRNGAALTEKYGDKVGCHYSEAEDGGLFWSNDPQTPILDMAQSLDLVKTLDYYRHNKQLQDKIRGQAMD